MRTTTTPESGFASIGQTLFVFLFIPSVVVAIALAVSRVGPKYGAWAATGFAVVFSVGVPLACMAALTFVGWVLDRFASKRQPRISGPSGAVTAAPSAPPPVPPRPEEA